MSCELEVTYDTFGNPRKVRGPAVKLVELPVGAMKDGERITRFTPAWARIVYEEVASCVSMERMRQSGHAIEGRVRIRGRWYSAFVQDDEHIVVRGA